MRSFFTSFMCLMALLIPLQGCAQLTYSAKAIQGRIVDADTGQPLEGVNIVAQWKIDRASVGDAKALLHVTETVTDANGNYSFPAWGPINLPPMADFGQGRDPLLSIFKGGYEPEFLDNGVVSDIRYRTIPLGEFRWNGKIISLRKWTGDLKDYARRIGFLANGLPYQAGTEWRNYPRMLLALDREDKRLIAIGYPQGNGVPGVHIEKFSKEEKDYLNKYSK